MRHFNIAGPCDPAMHYRVPPEALTSPAGRTLTLLRA